MQTNPAHENKAVSRLARDGGSGGVGICLPNPCRWQAVGSTETMPAWKAEQLFDLQNALLAAVVEMVEFRDGRAAGHIHRICCYLKLMLDQMLSENIYADEISTWDLEAVIPASQLHDLGKVIVPDAILNKPGALTDEETELARAHAQAGVELILRIEAVAGESAFLRHARVIAGSHHERWDGSGYPFGLTGYRIPLEGRMMAIADVFDAIVTDRPYRRARSFAQANAVINDGRGTEFDPILVDVFNQLAGRFAQVAIAYRAGRP